MAIRGSAGTNSRSNANFFASTLYLLFPPFSEAFQTYNWFSLAPYYAHLIAVLNAAMGALLMCGRRGDWRHNLVLALRVFAPKKLGITVPLLLLGRADEVIE
jgi:hypothetical protein